MIKACKIGNFKAFGEAPQSFPIKPLTIIFGPNSSGKSTILHSLLFAHHAARTGDLDVVYPDLAEETVDLGGFRQFIHGAQRGIESRLSWAADCSARDLAAHLDTRRTELNRQLGGPESNDWRALIADLTSLEIALAVGIPRDDKGKPIATARPRVERMECLADGKLILSGFSIDGRNLQIDQVASDHPLITRMSSTLAAAESFALELSDTIRERIAKEIDGLVADLRVETDGILPKKLYDAQAKRRTTTESEVRRPELGSAEGIAKAIRRSLPRMMDELLVGISDLIRKDLFTTKYLGPLRSYPPRHIAFAEAKDLGSRAGGGHAWLEVARDEKVRAKVNGWLSDAGKLKTPYRIEVERFYTMRSLDQPLRDAQEDAINYGVQDLLHAEFLSSDLVQEYADLDSDSDKERRLREEIRNRIDNDEIFEQWLLPRLHGRMAAEGYQAPGDVVLIDERTRTRVSHRDVGIGISQVLPVLVAAYGSRNQILAIEQPEIHLHPALQAELADVFIEAATGENRSRCILETHSEHLILRVLRRLRESSRASTPKLRGSDVCILFVAPGKEGSEVLEVRVSDDGDLIDPWPGGFFPERVQEIFGA